ncbi:MAG: TatD family hydrolase [Planctomycetota bacterium JB042]
MTSPLVDIGVNLTNRAFERDLDDVLRRAGAESVTRMVVTGVSVSGSRSARDLAARHPGTLWATAGVHPHNTRCCTPRTIDELRDVARDERVVAIGECGLDFDRNHSPRQVQLEWFERQVELAIELGLPLFLHERNAAQEVVDVLTRHRSAIPRAVLHCFTGDRAALEAYLELDLHVGITGWICDERRGTHLPELVREIADDRLMVETDAPFLLPRTVRPKPRKGRNEPSLLPHVVAAIAAATGRPTDAVAEATTRTAEHFFGIGTRSG